MKNIINETEAIAYNYLKAFGFEDGQIIPLIIQGKKDLYKELTKLESLLYENTVSLDAINNVVHALKGLLFHMGNHELAEKLNETRSYPDNETALKEISQLLFDEQ